MRRDVARWREVTNRIQLSLDLEHFRHARSLQPEPLRPRVRAGRALSRSRGGHLRRDARDVSRARAARAARGRGIARGGDRARRPRRDARQQPDRMDRHLPRRRGDRRGAGAVQHLVEAARDRFPARGLARAHAVRARPVRRPGLRRRPHGAAAEARRALPGARDGGHPRQRFGARRPRLCELRCGAAAARRAAAAGRARRRRRHRLHPVYLRVDRVSQGGAAPARRHDRERLQHRRAPGPAARRAGAPAAAALLVLRLGQRHVLDLHPRRDAGAAGPVRAGGDDRPDRAPCLRADLHDARHHHRDDHARVVPPRAHPQPAQRDDDRHPAGHRHRGRDARRARDLQRLRPDRVVRQLLRHLAPLAARAPHAGPGSAAARRHAPHRRSRQRAGAAPGRGRADRSEGQADARLRRHEQRAERQGVHRRRLLPHRRPRPAHRRGRPPVRGARQRDDQARRDQHRARRDRGGAAATPGRRRRRGGRRTAPDQGRGHRRLRRAVRPAPRSTAKSCASTAARSRRATRRPTASRSARRCR